MKKKKRTRVCTDTLKLNCDEMCQILRALAHPGRLMILGHLMAGEKTVSELQEASGLSQSQLSQFLSRMRLEKLVRSRREGRFQLYSAADTRILHIIDALQTVCKR